MISRHNSMPPGTSGTGGGKPSPYPAKARPHDREAASAGIGGPPKRRESMSGMGNNLRSHHPAGLGRSVAKSSTSAYNSPPQPQSLPREDPRRPVYRRGSLGTAAAATADATQRAAGPTVFPTNRGYAAQEMTPSPLSPSSSQGSSLLASLQSPSPGQAAQNPLIVRIVHRAHSVSTNRRGQPQNSASPKSATGMDIGSPTTGDIRDIVGSPSRPSVIYAFAEKRSGIGGSASGKQVMQERPGLGGKYGKDWMADRPSGIGSSAPQDSHPESGLSKVLKSLSFGRKGEGRQ
ncbi:hypothetical protein IWW38_002260 [Coemansia aciculifera]|uniref:Uncharacterized protein n=1 Tax=Coemansia aciculifera TaxID=417176 RepID=A0ACC1M5Q1_9FUNG|nr:hypothetical protein IWW38_002260 [Coemansia aciculifera]